MRIEFDRMCSTERRHDSLILMDCHDRVLATRSGRDPPDWSPDIVVIGYCLFLILHFMFSIFFLILNYFR